MVENLVEQSAASKDVNSVVDWVDSLVVVLVVDWVDWKVVWKDDV